MKFSRVERAKFGAHAHCCSNEARASRHGAWTSTSMCERPHSGEPGLATMSDMSHSRPPLLEVEFRGGGSGGEERPPRPSGHLASLQAISAQWPSHPLLGDPRAKAISVHGRSGGLACCRSAACMTNRLTAWQQVFFALLPMRAISHSLRGGCNGRTCGKQISAPAPHSSSWPFRRCGREEVHAGPFWRIQPIDIDEPPL